jgi:pyruvate/2-oxoglutarate dehydrogenase complex dihydrolipoamide dehydrogenase (E3) component
VIGAGPPGENAAHYAIQDTGLSAVLLEQELVGGECSHWACMPSKLVADPPLDVPAVLARRDAFTNHPDDARQHR